MLKKKKRQLEDNRKTKVINTGHRLGNTGGF